MRIKLTERGKAVFKTVGKAYGIKGKAIIVEPERGPSCMGCMNSICKSGKRFLNAENPLGLHVEKGQLVELEIHGGPPRRLILAAFLPLILGFAAGYGLVRLILPKSGETAAALTGMVFFFAAAFMVYMIRKNKNAAADITVSRIIIQ